MLHIFDAADAATELRRRVAYGSSSSPIERGKGLQQVLAENAQCLSPADKHDLSLLRLVTQTGSRTSSFLRVRLVCAKHHLENEMIRHHPGAVSTGAQLCKREECKCDQGQLQLASGSLKLIEGMPERNGRFQEQPAPDRQTPHQITVARAGAQLNLEPSLASNRKKEELRLRHLRIFYCN